MDLSQAPIFDNQWYDIPAQLCWDMGFGEDDNEETYNAVVKLVSKTDGEVITIRSKQSNKDVKWMIDLDGNLFYEVYDGQKEGSAFNDRPVASNDIPVETEEQEEKEESDKIVPTPKMNQVPPEGF